MNTLQTLEMALEALDELMGWQTLAPAQTQRNAQQAITALRQQIALEKKAEKQEIPYVLVERDSSGKTVVSAMPSKQPADEPVAIHCKAKRENKGVCPHHNLQCGWPKCNEAPAVADAVISTGQLSKMFQDLKGIDTSQSGYHWRVGWNAALRQAMDYSMPPIYTRPQPADEPVAIVVAAEYEDGSHAGHRLEWRGRNEVNDFPEGTEFYTRPQPAAQSGELTPQIKSAYQHGFKDGFESVQMRKPKVGDRVVCIEDESLATVESLTGGGSPDIKFDDGSHGTYLLREFAELFRYADPQPAAWVGLTDEDKQIAFDDTQEASGGFWEFADAIEAKLKEKNRG